MSAGESRQTDTPASSSLPAPWYAALDLDDRARIGQPRSHARRRMAYMTDSVPRAAVNRSMSSGELGPWKEELAATSLSRGGRRASDERRRAHGSRSRGATPDVVGDDRIDGDRPSAAPRATSRRDRGSRRPSTSATMRAARGTIEDEDYGSQCCDSARRDTEGGSDLARSRAGVCAQCQCWGLTEQTCSPAPAASSASTRSRSTGVDQVRQPAGGWRVAGVDQPQGGGGRLRRAARPSVIWGAFLGARRRRSRRCDCHRYCAVCTSQRRRVSNGFRRCESS